MKHLILGLALIAGTAQAAPPPCWPKQLGSTGSDYKRGTTPDGQWLAWTCTARGRTTVHGPLAVTGYEIKHPDVTGLTPMRTARAYWDANVADDNDPRIVRLRTAAREAFGQ